MINFKRTLNKMSGNLSNTFIQLNFVLFKTEYAVKVCICAMLMIIMIQVRKTYGKALVYCERRRYERRRKEKGAKRLEARWSITDDRWFGIEIKKPP